MNSDAFAFFLPFFLTFDHEIGIVNNDCTETSVREQNTVYIFIHGYNDAYLGVTSYGKLRKLD